MANKIIKQSYFISFFDKLKSNCLGIACLTLVLISFSLSGCIIRQGGQVSGVSNNPNAYNQQDSLQNTAINADIRANSAVILQKFTELTNSANSKNSGLWNNDATSTHGLLTLGEASQAAKANSQQICRSFKTTRESFDGASLFNGIACRNKHGTWQLNSLQQVE